MRTAITNRCGQVGVLAALLVGGCSEGTTASPAAAPVDWHGFEARTPSGADAGAVKSSPLAESYLAAFATPGWPALSPLLDSEARFSMPGVADARGREGVVRAHESLFGAFDGRAASASRVFRTDALQIVEWTLSGVQARDWMGVPATRKPVVIRGVTLLSTRDGATLSDVHVVFDVAVVKAQLGAGPKELASLPAPAPASGAPQVIEQAHTADEAANVAAARSWLDSLERNDEAGYLARASDDVLLELPERAQPVRGRDELKAQFKTLRKAIGQLDATVESSVGLGHYAVVEYAVAGEQLGAFGWIAAQRDRVVRLHMVDVIELRDGKFAHVWRYDNPGEIIGSGP